MKIPYSSKQGIITRLQGIETVEQGMLPSEITDIRNEFAVPWVAIETLRDDIAGRRTVIANGGVGSSSSLPPTQVK